MMAQNIVVVDSLTKAPLPSASVFDKNGTLLGICNAKGRSPYISKNDFPITVRYLGYLEKSIPEIGCYTVFLTENPTELPEVVVSSRQQKVLHILGYVREYSTLTTYTDTVFLFREKMVDFMLVPDKKVKFKGWTNPRVLKSKSYYRFTNSHGLDSVSDESNYHFSWSDWIDAIPSPKMPSRLKDMKISTDTVMGKYQPTEIWERKEDRVTINVNVLADTVSRKWVNNLSTFFRDGLEFEDFRLRYSYDNIVTDSIHPVDMTGFSFNIESQGRGREMFRFNKRDQPFFVSTYGEVYILDKEYITLKEARRWADRKLDFSEVEILEPEDAPELQPSIHMLIDRVNHIDKNQVKLGFVPDHRMIRKYPRRNNFNIGTRALAILKQLTGITYFRANRNFNNNWRDFRREQQRRNQKLQNGNNP